MSRPTRLLTFTETGFCLTNRAAQIRRTLSLASLDSLLTIAQNDQEREKFLLNVRATGKSMIWRDEKETRKLPNDVERALVLACRGGLSE